MINKILVLVTIIATVLSASTAFALTPADRRLFDMGIGYFNSGDAPVTCTPTNTGGGGSTEENAAAIWGFFASKGLAPFQIAGIMGNFKRESGLNPRRVQSTPTPEGDEDMPVGGKGYGLAQWTNDLGPNGEYVGRQAALVALAQLRQTIAGDLNTQLEFVWQELNSTERRALDELLLTTNVDTATAVFEERYERAGVVALEQRIAFAREFLEQFGGQTITPQVTTGSRCGNQSTGNGPIELDDSGCPTGPIPQSETVLVDGIRVHPCIQQEVQRIMQLAREQNLNMSGSGWRSAEQQIQLRREHCGTTDYDIYEKPANECSPPTAIPGRSRHERGTAVDFTCNGRAIPTRTSTCFIFLRDNTLLKNLPSEPWHWSIDGS